MDTRVVKLLEEPEAVTKLMVCFTSLSLFAKTFPQYSAAFSLVNFNELINSSFVLIICRKHCH